MMVIVMIMIADPFSIQMVNIMVMIADPFSIMIMITDPFAIGIPSMFALPTMVIGTIRPILLFLFFLDISGSIVIIGTTIVMIIGAISTIVRGCVVSVRVGCGWSVRGCGWGVGWCRNNDRRSGNL
jgi:hypothetical protein